MCKTKYGDLLLPHRSIQVWRKTKRNQTQLDLKGNYLNRVDALINCHPAFYMHRIIVNNILV